MNKEKIKRDIENFVEDWRWLLTDEDNETIIQPLDKAIKEKDWNAIPGLIEIARRQIKDLLQTFLDDAERTVKRARKI